MKTLTVIIMTLTFVVVYGVKLEKYLEQKESIWTVSEKI